MTKIVNTISTVVIYASGRSKSEYAYVMKKDTTPIIIAVRTLKKFIEQMNIAQAIAIGNKILSIITFLSYLGGSSL